jgi:site-specific recombinase XerD
MQAILNAPEPSGWDGLRDRAMLHLCFAGGLRVSELVGLQLGDVTLQPQATVLVHGKGPQPAPEVFVSARGQPLTRSGFEYILAKHVQAAIKDCPSLSAKRVSPHVLRHTCALTVLQATKDLRKVSLWLGHAHMQTTEMYTRADPSVKLEALEAMIAPTLRSGRFKATDTLNASLTSRSVMRSNTPSR